MTDLETAFESALAARSSYADLVANSNGLLRTMQENFRRQQEQIDEEGAGAFFGAALEVEYADDADDDYDDW